jgi:aspartate carbamoyltransferase catalytic subunit
MHPGPVNRGIELSGEVVDSPQAVITAQVEAGVVVRMAVLYDLLAGARTSAPAPDMEPQPA